MNRIRTILHFAFAVSFVCSIGAQSGYFGTTYVLSAPPPPDPATTAIHMSSNSIVSWADAYTDMIYGSNVAAEWMTPGKALGPALGTVDDIVSLGRGGSIVLSFPDGISDGPGPDFAVFENSFDDSFLELAYVEVSSDGTNFIRFPNYSYTPDPVSGFGTVQTRLLFGFAGKYRREYGTPFDLYELQLAYDAALAGQTDFSEAYTSGLTNSFPAVDLSRITHVRLVDVVGDGTTSRDCRGYPVFDPYPTSISAGFDLEAIGVMHEAESPVLSVLDTNGVFVFECYFNQFNFSGYQVQSSTNMISWTSDIPSLIDQSTNEATVHVLIQFSLDAENRFYRLMFNEL